ncbi:MAG: peptide deformylase [Planctomycetota bacterium]
MDVVIYPGSSLRRGGKTIDSFDDELRQVVSDMFETMYSHNGVGLAAPQVGLPLNLFVLNPAGNADEKDGEMVLINPEIVKRKGHEFGEEGCLSFPGLYAEVERSKDVRVKYQDLDGEEHEERFEGFLARIVQHEADHLKGVVFTDRLSAVEKLRVRGALQDFERKSTQKS